GVRNRARHCDGRTQLARSVGDCVCRNRREDFGTRETGRNSLQNPRPGRTAASARISAIELQLRSAKSLSYLQKAIRPVRSRDRNRRMADPPGLEPATFWFVAQSQIVYLVGLFVGLARTGACSYPVFGGRFVSVGAES